VGDRFLERLKQRKQQATAQGHRPAPEQKPIEEMADAELDEALGQAKRELLDAQHEALRERELARARGGGVSSPSTRTSKPMLADVLREARGGRPRSTRHW
jgi:hypothetical protein